MTTQIYKTYNQPSDVYDKIAKAYLAIGNDEEALRFYKLYLQANPNNALQKYDYAKLLYRHKIGSLGWAVCLLTALPSFQT